MIVVHSQEYAGLFKTPNVEVIHPPVTMRLRKNFRPEERLKQPFTVIYVGQFRAFKGINVLLGAASLLKDVNFILVGEGPLKPNFTRLANHLGLSNTMFENKVDDHKLQKLYEGSHVVCLPSLNTTEAYGLVLIEGALHGCLPMASDLLGVKENAAMLRGLVFQRGSYLSLAKELKLLSSNRELYMSLAEKSQKAAQEYVKIYTPEYYVRKHEKLFMKCISG
jgi:rhamnosyl/mannosyltransferase